MDKRRFSEYTDLHRTDYGTGYKKSLNDFKDVLRDASKYMITTYFKEDVKVIKVQYKKDTYIFLNPDGTQISIEKVHEYIQKDVVLQRILYNIWMGLYR